MLAVTDILRIMHLTGQLDIVTTTPSALRRRSRPLRCPLIALTLRHMPAKITDQRSKITWANCEDSTTFRYRRP